MRYKLLGKSGLRVSEICLGTLNFGEGRDWGASEAESAKIFEAFAEAGGNFLDTSSRYARGVGEEFLGDLVASERERFVISTKYTLSMNEDDPNASGNHRKNMVQALEASLRRLRTDYVDLYLVHTWDFTTPVEELMRALDDVVRAGKALHVGISNTPAWIVSRANTLAELRGWSPFVNLQVEYSLLQREPERELLPMARGLGIGVTAYSPLGAGWLAGESTPGEPPGAYRLSRVGGRANERNASIAAAVREIAGEIGRPASQVALNWIRQRKDAIIPIVGAENVGQASENLGCVEFELPDEHVKRLDDVSEIEPGYPHDLLERPDVRDRVYGGTRYSLDFDP
jgi:aryl-alcohol dehydrogenase-like predicted oxidoreductase